jgi:hypothetical protein
MLPVVRAMVMPAVAVCLLTGCGAPATPRGSAFLEQLERRPESFVAEVARARHLPVSAPVRIMLEDDAAFAAAIGQMEAKVRVAPTAGGTKAFYMAFHFAGKRPAGAARPSSAAEVLDEQLVGFYDDRARVIHVRRSKLRRGGAADELEHRFVIAHEVEHALVHQRFGDMLPRGIADDDERIARMALLEGDASFAALLALAERAHKLPRRVLARVSDYLRAGAVDRAAAGDGDSKALRAAPANERERMLFPYNAGLALLNEIYRAGGLGLVDAAFGRPPRTTEQVLHPAKYLEGEPPVVVRAPAAPAGWEAPVTGRMGELMTSVVLARCLTPEASKAAAAGWGGDAYTIAVDPGGHVAVLWSTAWDDEASAARFASEVTAHAACLGEGNLLGPWVLGEGLSVVREGRRVGLVMGLTGASGKHFAAALPSLVEPTQPSTPPFGEVALVPVKPRPSAAPGRLVPGGWVSDMLGVAAPVWPGFEVKTRQQHSFVMSADQPSFVLVGLELLEEPVSAEANERVFSAIEQVFNKESKARFVTSWQGTTELPLGRGVARQWVVPGTTFAATVAVLPICSGTGAYVVTTAWTDALSHDAATRWVAGLRRAGGEPPICADLDP